MPGGWNEFPYRCRKSKSFLKKMFLSESGSVEQLKKGVQQVFQILPVEPVVVLRLIFS